MEFVAATVDGSVLLPWHVEEQLRGAADPGPSPAEPSVATQFRPIDEEIRELEKQRMAAALSAAKGVHVRAAELISMPIRTFSSKLKQYQLGTRKDVPGS